MSAGREEKVVVVGTRGWEVFVFLVEERRTAVWCAARSKTTPGRRTARWARLTWMYVVIFLWGMSRTRAAIPIQGSDCCCVSAIPL